MASKKGRRFKPNFMQPGTHHEPIEPRSAASWQDDLGRSVRVVFDERSRQVELVRQALGEGATWAQIGAVLGVTRASAFERFRDCRSVTIRDDP